MRKFYTAFLALLIALPAVAKDETTEKKESKYSYKFYGFIRTDLAYNSRESLAGCNDIFYLYPLDIELDSQGNDLNDISSLGFFSFASRVGVDVKGGEVGKAAASAKFETDFAGYGINNMLLRIRHAYVNLDWKSGSSLLVGQTWHPLFGEVMPYITNLSTGAPFQPFSRAPQVRYQHKLGSMKFTAAAMCQLQYTSNGPNGKSNEYMVNSCIPEVYLGADYYNGGFQLGGGVNMLNLKPRTEHNIYDPNDKTKIIETYKVDELMTAISGEVHMRYYTKKLKVGMKSLYASSLDYAYIIGGYGVTADSGNYEKNYTPFHNSTTWVNVTYGTTWVPSLYVGYTKNLGTTKELSQTSEIYGSGIDNELGTGIDQMLGVSLGLSYKRPSWTVGLEYSNTTAWYGDINLKSGRVNNTHDVANNRIAAIMVYFF